MTIKVKLPYLHLIFVKQNGTARSTMTESVGNEIIEKYWCFLIRNRH
jgi:hypothetical protein